jgi:CheY-like chemotaxis protein
MHTMSLDEAARRCVDLVRTSDRRLEARTLTIDVAPVLINADTARVEQIINNLLGNAIKFTGEDGTIVVTVAAEGSNAVLRVRDDGAGIAEELLPRVFDLFTQGEQRLDRREGGLGIGLTLVRTLAELQGGTARATSDGSGKGSEFVVAFALASELVTAAEPAKEATKRAKAQRVVIIEDNADARETLREVLVADGHEVFEAADGEKGIEISQRLKPDVVFVDIGLPGIDGYDVVHELRAREATLGVRWRIIALTGYGQPEDVRRAKEAGFDTHLVKPVFPEALQAAMRG